MTYGYLQLKNSVYKKCEILESWHSLNRNCIVYRVRILDTNEEYVSEDICDIYEDVNSRATIKLAQVL